MFDTISIIILTSIFIGAILYLLVCVDSNSDNILAKTKYLVFTILPDKIL
jgi:hypothetical protein